MTQAKVATPRLEVWLFKTISRDTVDGNLAVSGRYQNKKQYIDLTPFLHAGSSVRTSKSVRQPAGGFSINFADKPDKGWYGDELESLSGLIEPMDVIEVRMWGGIGPAPSMLPIVMRGLVSRITRQRVVGEDGRPQRVVTVTGLDYGKVWQTYQILYMRAYQPGKPLLSDFKIWEMFGVEAKNTMPAAEFVREVVEKIINKHMREFLPADMGIPVELILGDGIAVQHGVVSNNYQNSDSTIYEMLRFHGDVGVWNELYTEDREDGVHVVYRPIPAYLLSNSPDRGTSKIQEDAPDPPIGVINDYEIKSIDEGRADENIANFFWVNASRFDLIDSMARRLMAIGADSPTVSLTDYANAAPKFYGWRAMYAETQQGGDEITYLGSNLLQAEQEARRGHQGDWIDERRRIMLEMNKDNVVYEQGSAVVKGGPVRANGQDGHDLLKAGDYAEFRNGSIVHYAYVHQVDHEFMPFQGYTTTLHFDRGEGFATRASMEGSPWLSEQATRSSDA